MVGTSGTYLRAKHACGRATLAADDANAFQRGDQSGLGLVRTHSICGVWHRHRDGGRRGRVSLADSHGRYVQIRVCRCMIYLGEYDLRLGVPKPWPSWIDLLD